MSQQYTEEMLEVFPGLPGAPREEQAAFLRVWSFSTRLRDALNGLAQATAFACDATARRDARIVCEAVKRSFACMLLLKRLRDELLLPPIDPGDASWIRAIDTYVPKDWGVTPRPEGF